MSFAFKGDESLPHAVRRVALHQIERTAKALTGGGRHRRPSAAAIHDARKRLKRVRALLRLAREGLGAKAFHRQNQTLRDLGRLLSAARDAAILVTALDDLAKHAGEPAHRHPSIARLRRELVAHRRMAAQHPDAGETEDIAETLRKTARQIEHWKLNDLTRHAMLDGLRRTYRDGRRAMGCAIRDPHPERLHEWRKRVKDLWHHAQLLAATWPAERKGFDDSAHRLADLLGDDHDLVVLSQTISQNAEALGIPSADVALLLGWIDRRRAELQREAFALGHRLYDRKPKDFVKEIGARLGKE